MSSVLPTVYCGNDDGISVSACLSFGAKFGAEVKAGVDLVNVKSGPVHARIGLNVDTETSVGSDGVETKFLGFGVSVGRKTGISTPFGEIKTDCVIQ